MGAVVSESVELATILLTDLVGSTRLGTSVGPVRADELREEHFGLLRPESRTPGVVARGVESPAPRGVRSRSRSTTRRRSLILLQLRLSSLWKNPDSVAGLGRMPCWRMT